jgi:hypothetical protein
MTDEQPPHGLDPAAITTKLELAAALKTIKGTTSYDKIRKASSELVQIQKAATAIASNDRRLNRMPFELEVTRRLKLPDTGFAWDDPLVTWQEGRAHVRRLQLNQQPGYRGPEIWRARVRFLIARDSGALAATG